MDRLQLVRGHLVSFPLDFMCQEDLRPYFSESEYYTSPQVFHQVAFHGKVSLQRLSCTQYMRQLVDVLQENEENRWPQQKFTNIAYSPDSSLFLGNSPMLNFFLLQSKEYRNIVSSLDSPLFFQVRNTPVQFILPQYRDQALSPKLSLYMYITNCFRLNKYIQTDYLSYRNWLALQCSLPVAPV